MVEDRITDGKRIAQFLSSELSGREDGILDDVDVVDANPEAEPSPEGTVAYGISLGGERIATVELYSDAAAIAMAADAGAPDTDAPDGESVDADAFDSRVDTDEILEHARDSGLTAECDGGVPVVRIESGARVKRALDALLAGIDP